MKMKTLAMVYLTAAALLLPGWFRNRNTTRWIRSTSSSNNR